MVFRETGGLYLDTDIIAMRDDMMELTNSIGWQKPRFSGILNGAVLKLAAYHPCKLSSFILFLFIFLLL